MGCVADTVGYHYVKSFDTTGCRNPSRDDSRQYDERVVAVKLEQIEQYHSELKGNRRHFPAVSSFRARPNNVRWSGCSKM